ncbi:MAG: FAD-binding protein, partial [candidate division Zixibacteria bacterium]|nr:FAD-binding protein [Gammaproteobacteria bacterium]NIR65369.1 FAD-binding protein [candidate division Zixibacteria bacterium]NIS47326.1 FAD-binding protein [candidate division Zixibacteria bacterium]NIV07528.1 FAD-binding protein [candidate division Zixibacteria bacterium]NIW40306.1 FAD-binding protein [candidate division Zixibacteria bacterium]
MAGDPYKEIKDIIIVGAGPGGSSAAAFLAGQGFSVLLLDKDRFPRDKVCGDALTPKALYWLEVLGCADSVLERTKSCLTQGSVFINDEHVLTSTFPRNTGYPWFSILLKRKDLDHILVHHAVSKGVHFIPDCKAAKLQQESECMSVEAETPEGMRTFRARLVIGADGANSLVSRAIGNQISQGVAAVG